MDKKRVCSKYIWTGLTQYHRCSRATIVERDGQPYCKIHDPEYIKAKEAKRDAVRRVTACPECGSKPNHWWSYCPLCGTKYPARKIRSNTPLEGG